MCLEDDKSIESIDQDRITLLADGREVPFPKTLEGLLRHLKIVKPG